MREAVIRYGSLPIIAVMLVLAMIYVAVALSVVPASTYTSGYQGIDAQIKGVYINSARHQDKGRLTWSGTYWLDSKLLEPEFTANNNMIKFTYTPTSGAPAVRICDEIWCLPSVYQILPDMIRLDVDRDGDPGGMADLVAIIDTPIIDDSIYSIAQSNEFFGRKQALGVPYNIFTWEVKDNDGVTHRFRIDEYILKAHLSISVYPTSTDEHRSMYDGVWMWIDYIPVTTQYFRSVEGADLKSVHFGIGKIEVSSVKKKLGKEGETSGWAYESRTEVEESRDMAIYNNIGISPQESIIYEPPNWEQAQMYENYQLDPNIFRDHYFVPWGSFDVGCWDTSKNVISDFFFGWDAYAVVFDVEYKVYTFVVGEWIVAQTYDIEWEGLEPYYASVKGLFDYISDALGRIADFFTSPFGILLSIVFLIIILAFLIILLRGICGIGAGGGRVQIVTVPVSKQYDDMLNAIRNMRDKYLKPYRFGRAIIWSYYNVFSPILVAIILLFGRVGAWLVRNCVTKPIYMLTQKVEVVK